MDDDQPTITALREAMGTAARGRYLDADVATRAWTAAMSPRPARRSGRALRSAAAVAATVVGVGSGATALAIWSSDKRASPTPGSDCSATVSTSALPSWARAGFQAGAGDIPHVAGARGEIVGVLFADPLRVRPPAGRHNKVLWVAKDPGQGPLTIRAGLEGTQVSAVRTVPDGPGPSYLDLPRPGCWTLVLTWSGHRDTVSVEYLP